MTAFKFPWGVEGYLSPQEGQYLYRLACRVPEGRSIVELGTYKGRSLLCMVQSGRRVIGVDHFEGQPELPKVPGIYADHLGGSYLEELYRNRVKWDPGELSVIRRGSTSDRQLADKIAEAYGPIGMVFVDGDHSGEGVRKDFAAWERHLAPDGLMVFHDANFRGPRALMVELCARGGWEIVGQAGQVRALRRVAKPASFLDQLADRLRGRNTKQPVEVS